MITTKDAVVSAAAGLAAYYLIKRSRGKIAKRLKGFSVPIAVAAGPLAVMAVNRVAPSALI